eukprot:6201599-Pleurochrysis_carterae.AAC.1
MFSKSNLGSKSSIAFMLKTHGTGTTRNWIDVGLEIARERDLNGLHTVIPPAALEAKDGIAAQAVGMEYSLVVIRVATVEQRSAQAFHLDAMFAHLLPRASLCVDVSGLGLVSGTFSAVAVVIGAAADTRARTSARTRSGAHAHAHTRAHARARTRTHARALTHPHTHVRTRTYAHTDARTRARTRTRAHARALTHAHSPTHTRTHARTRTRAHSRALTRTRTGARTHVRTHASLCFATRDAFCSAGTFSLGASRK